MTGPDPKISIVIPTYQQEQMLGKCLDSIEAATDFEAMSCEVIVVANGASESHMDVVRGREGPYKLLSYPEPLGYVKAANIGIVASRGQYVLLLNDDTEILDWGGNNVWLKMLADPMDENPSLAATGSTMDIWGERPDQKFLVFYCVMIRRRLLLEEGLLDESFHPGCGEDMDFCFKVRAKGYEVRQVPTEIPYWATHFPIWHVGNMTVGRLPNLEELTGRNHKVLEERYPRTDADREANRKFSEGRQNIHLWNPSGA